MKVAFGVSLSPGTPLLQEKDTRRFIDLAKMADDYGAEAVGTHDTAFIGGDAYVRATLIALGASRARVGLRPTNPLTREPQVMASFLASIDSLTGGRAFMDMASGDSAVLNIGYEVATRARIEDYVTCVRDLLAKGEATYQGRPQRVRWASTVTRQRIPISICAEGPKMLHLGGRIGDGVTDELRAKIQEYVDGYELYDHVLHEGRNPKRMEALGLTNYALERFALAGNASDWVKRIELIAEAGARKIWVSLRATDMDTQHH